MTSSVPHSCLSNHIHIISSYFTWRHVLRRWGQEIETGSKISPPFFKVAFAQGKWMAPTAFLQDRFIFQSWWIYLRFAYVTTQIIVVSLKLPVVTLYYTDRQKIYHSQKLQVCNLVQNITWNLIGRSIYRELLPLVSTMKVPRRSFGSNTIICTYLL